MTETVNVVSEGMVKNPFDRLKPEWFGTTINDAYPKPEPDASGGFLQTVIGPDKLIMDTDYFFKANEILKMHNVYVRGFGSMIGVGGPAFVIEYWKRDVNTLNETLVWSLDLDWHDDITDEFGDAAGYVNFHENYDYRFVIKSHPALKLNDWVGVDWIMLNKIDDFAVQIDSIYGGDVPATAQIERIRFTVTGNNTPTASATYKFPVTPEAFHLAYSLETTSPDFTTAITDYADDGSGFTVSVSHKNDNNWTGGVGISCVVISHYRPKSL